MVGKNPYRKVVETGLGFIVPVRWEIAIEYYCATRYGA